MYLLMEQWQAFAVYAACFDIVTWAKVSTRVQISHTFFVLFLTLAR